MRINQVTVGSVDLDAPEHSDGHRLCLFRAGENRRDPPWRIESD